MTPAPVTEVEGDGESGAGPAAQILPPGHSSRRARDDAACDDAPRGQHAHRLLRAPPGGGRLPFLAGRRGRRGVLLFPHGVANLLRNVAAHLAGRGLQGRLRPPRAWHHAQPRGTRISAGPELQALLERREEYTRRCQRAQDRIIPYVFHRSGSPIRAMRESWKTACRRAVVPGRLLRDLRRSAVRNLERAGVSRSVAMKMTGHKTESVYRR
jgi:hypothetical protein